MDAPQETRCPACGYDLEGLAAGLCPECGAGFAWPLADAGGRNYAIVGAMGRLGLSLFFYVGGMVLTVSDVSRGRVDFVDWVIVPLNLGLVGAIYVAWRRRNRLAAMPEFQQGVVVLGCWMLPIALIAVVYRLLAALGIS